MTNIVLAWQYRPTTEKIDTFPHTFKYILFSESANFIQEFIIHFTNTAKTKIVRLLKRISKMAEWCINGYGIHILQGLPVICQAKLFPVCEINGRYSPKMRFLHLLRPCCKFLQKYHKPMHHIHAETRFLIPRSNVCISNIKWVAGYLHSR